MLRNSYSSKILYEKFHGIYLRGDIKLFLVTVNRLILEIEIALDLLFFIFYSIYFGGSLQHLLFVVSDILLTR